MRLLDTKRLFYISFIIPFFQAILEAGSPLIFPKQTAKSAVAAYVSGGR